MTATELHVRGVRLPDRSPVEFWTDRGRISFRPVAEAPTVIADGYIAPGLVDAHSHPGAPGPGSRWTSACCATT